ncbi:HAD hydrolase-like protein, partial [uncultured Bilophila sp.]
LPQLELEPGLVETLGWLKGRGVRLAVHTNRGNGMWDLLDRFGLRAAFDPVMTAETVAPKPSPEGVRRILEYWNLPPASVGFIGDSATDAAAARGGEVPLLAYGNPRLEAAVHIDSFPRLREALERMPGVGR